MPNGVNKFAIAGGLMCGIANLFAIYSLATPNWVVTEFLGTVQFGLTSLCQQSLEQEVICVTPNLPSSWTACLVFIIFGILTLTLTCILLILSQWKPKATEYGKWIAVISLMNLSLAAVIFPVGFDSPEIGGMSFQLPTNTSLGSSYVSFIFSIAFTFLGEVCMRKGHSTVHAL